MTYNVRQIINEATLDLFTREVIAAIKKHPDAKIETKAQLEEKGGLMWFTVVLNYTAEVR